jgi:SEC-C motif-containing protein
MTPQQFLAQRFADLEKADYAAVYASYHAEAPFLQSFPDCAAYVAYAEQYLGAVQIRAWKILRQRTLAADRQEHLLLMELSLDGGSQFFYELALLIDTADGWRYHSAQKLSQEDYSGAPEQIDFCHFDQVAQKIVY